MLERFGEAKNYLGSVMDRTIGRAAWREAMQQPKRRPDDSYPSSWSIPINHALDTAAPFYAGLELIAPATSRFFVQTLKDPKTLERSSGLDLLRLAPDLALIGATIYLSHNPLEFVAMRLAANAAIHIGLDVADKIRRNPGPSGTALAV